MIFNENLKTFGNWIKEEHADDDNEASGTENDADIDEVIEFPFFSQFLTTFNASANNFFDCLNFHQHLSSKTNDLLNKNSNSKTFERSKRTERAINTDSNIHTFSVNQLKEQVDDLVINYNILAKKLNRPLLNEMVWTIGLTIDYIGFKYISKFDGFFFIDNNINFFFERMVMTMKIQMNRMMIRLMIRLTLMQTLKKKRFLSLIVQGFVYLYSLKIESNSV